MSVVAVRKYSDRLVFASDSIRVSGYLKESQRVAGQDMAKLFEVNSMVIGGVGLSMELSFMRIFARTHKPKAANSEAILDFVVEFYGWANGKDSGFGHHSEYLIGFENEAFRVADGYLIDKINEFSAIGAGEHFALTAMHLDKSPQEAVEIANELCVFCAPPVNVVEQPFKTP